ncbi:hypothetical protein HYI36_05210 [Bacillus sp. Gen3]|nr:hypothetical protein [Bacillus sp. Gen3]
MRYEEFAVVGDHSSTITYEGTPKEISELMQLTSELKTAQMPNITINTSCIHNSRSITDVVIKEIEKVFDRVGGASGS